MIGGVDPHQLCALRELTRGTILEHMAIANHLHGPTPKEFGALIRQLRIQQALSVSDLSQRSGLSATTVKALEGGDGDPSFAELRAVSRGLGMELSAIFRVWHAKVAALQVMN